MIDREYKKDCIYCGGNVEYEVHGEFRDAVCQNCGGVVGGGELVAEAQEPDEIGEDKEVME